jgi:hypothetical protein
MKLTFLKASIYCVMFVVCSIANAGIIATDSFGYSLSDIEYNLRDISSTGNDIGLDGSDDDVSIASIGFYFDFYGNIYSDVEISSNGFMSFTQTGNAACCSGETISTQGGSIDNFIAGYWEDLSPQAGGIVRAQTSGLIGSRIFTVGFYNVRDVDDPVNSVNTFEMILHELTNDIEIQYSLIQFEDVDDKVMGIENIDGSDGIELAFFEADSNFINGDVLFQNEGYCFSTATNCGISSVPEPSTLAIFALGMIGLASRRFKKQS